MTVAYRLVYPAEILQVENEVGLRTWREVRGGEINWRFSTVDPQWLKRVGKVGWLSYCGTLASSQIFIDSFERKMHRLTIISFPRLRRKLLEAINNNNLNFPRRRWSLIMEVSGNFNATEEKDNNGVVERGSRRPVSRESLDRTGGWCLCAVAN